VRRGGGCGYRRHLAHRLQRIGRGLRAIEIAAINERGARALKNNEQKKRHPFHSADANRSVMACQSLDFFRKTRLHDVEVAGKFSFRQGLWIEDLRTRQGRIAATVV